MVGEFFSKINFVFQSLTKREVLDVLILTIIVYFFLLFFLRKRFLRVFLSFLLLSLLYFISSTFSLTISKAFFQNFFSFALLFLLIIFQKEIRNWFEFLGEWKIKRESAKAEFIVDEILKAISFFSKEKIGAILVFERLIPLESQLFHKVPLKCEINSQILESIFQKNSPLHDGAVLIQKTKIKYAACHLPLSEKENFSQKGTRHRAALGISEKTDALSIVVSEETGKVSLAKEGKIYFDVPLEKIREELLDYYQLKTFKIFGKKPLFFPSFKNIFVLLLAFLISLSIFFATALTQTFVVKEIEVPIEFKNLSQDLFLKQVSVAYAKVTLFAKKQKFLLLENEKLKFTIDLSNYKKPGQFFIELKPENLNQKDFQIQKISPQKIKILIEAQKTE